MKNKRTDQPIIAHLSLYNILEAFLAGTSDSFLVLDQDKNIVVFNKNFEEFIRNATGKQLAKSLPFSSFIENAASLQVLVKALDKAFVEGETHKFSFSIICNTRRWYDVELHPLKQDDMVTGMGIGVFETTHKREAEEAIKRSEALFKAVVTNSTDIFLLTDDLFRVTYASDAFKTILGIDPAELIGVAGFGLIHPDDMEAVGAWLAQVVERSETRPLEFRAKNNAGSWVYLEATGQNMLADKDVAALVFTIKDIHAKKVADMALVNAEQRLSLLLNNTKESFIILDDKFRVTAYNKSAQENAYYFFVTDLQSGLSLLDLVPPSEIDEYISLLDKVMQGKEMEKDTVFTDKEGKLHICHHTYRLLEYGNEKRVFITSNDITEKWQAEIQLKENEEKFKTLIEYSFDAIVIIDEKAKILYASPSIKSLFGYEVEELLNQNSFEFIHPDDIVGVQTKLVGIMTDREEEYADYRFRAKDGSYKWTEAKGKNMFNNKHINGILVSLRDITERKKLLNEQTELATELGKYNKDLQQFSFITSHNLRAPVANLISLLSLYNRDNPADPFNAELIDKLNESTNKLNDTLNDLINVLVVRAKPNADLEYVRFADMATEVEKNLHALLQATNGRIVSDFSEAEGVAYNKMHMESIFLNLISNAIKYSSPDRSLLIEIRSEKVAGGTNLYFSDNGIGIDLERYGDRIFGLYQRFNASKEGKGLGLYMIKSQITASGGSINIESTPGKGTTFIIHFRDGQTL